jgi:hypothetical protein
MGAIQVADVETYLAQVWNPDVRPLADEAWRCYNAGATRACITATWTSVTADIITKIVWLADEGDAAAATFRATLTNVQANGLNGEAVKGMQNIEASLLDKAEEFELIDSIGKRELERIREDRNLCAHPSLRALGDVYQPQPEVARGHLVVALTTLLTHPPVQGRKIVDEFTNYMCDPRFVSAPAHIQATFFERVRSATRKTVVKFAAKHALLELDPGGRMPPAEHADRMAVALAAFANRDRELVRSAVAEQIARFHTLDGSAQLRAVARPGLGDQDYFWDAVDQPLAERLEGLLAAPVAVADYEPLPPDLAASLAVVRSPDAREKMAGLEVRFTSMPWAHRLSIVGAARPDAYFMPAIIEIVKWAPNWRAGEQAGRLLVQHAQFLSSKTLQSALDCWCQNVDCRRASGMPALAVALFEQTAHLGAARSTSFTEFLTGVRALAGEGDDYYTYPALEDAMRKAGCIA